MTTVHLLSFLSCKLRTSLISSIINWWYFPIHGHTWPQIVHKSPHNMKTINKLATELQVQQPCIIYSDIFTIWCGSTSFLKNIGEREGEGGTFNQSSRHKSSELFNETPLFFIIQIFLPKPKLGKIKFKLIKCHFIFSRWTWNGTVLYV